MLDVFCAWLNVIPIKIDDKITEIYDRSERMRDVLGKIVETGVSFEKPVAFVVNEKPLKGCYSVFSQPVTHGFGKNTAFKVLNGWRETKAVVVTSDKISSLPSDVRVVRLD